MDTITLTFSIIVGLVLALSLGGIPAYAPCAAGIQCGDLRPLPSPLYQFKEGIEAKNVLCYDGFVVVIKFEDNSPVCVKPPTAQKLVERVWGNLISVLSSTSNASSAKTQPASSIFANCSISDGCIADCSPPAVDPIATSNKNYDLYDGCILAGMKVAGMNEAWQGKILKAQMVEESGLSPLVVSGTYNCGGQNCGPWAISAGSISGDSAPGPCGSSEIDPATGLVDYSHSYGLFQSTPACDGVFALTTSLSGHTCTATTKENFIPFGSSVYFYCESETSINNGQHYIDATQNVTSSLYAKSVFNPAYQIYVYFAQWPSNFAMANSKTTGCTLMEQWYQTLAYWLTGNVRSSCTMSSGTGGYNYVKNIIEDYQSTLYGTAWPDTFP